MVWATVSSRSCFNCLYKSFSIFGCKGYNQSDFGVSHLVMSMCRVFSGVFGRGCLLWPVHSLGKTLFGKALGLGDNLRYFIVDLQKTLIVILSKPFSGMVLCVNIHGVTGRSILFCLEWKAMYSSSANIWGSGRLYSFLLVFDFDTQQIQ